MKNPIAIIGAGGHAAVILDMLNDMYVPVRIFDDFKPRGTPVIDNVGVSGDVEYSFQNLVYQIYYVAIGDNQAREKMTQRLSQEKRRTGKALIHPRAIVSDKANIRNGSIVMAGAIIQIGANISEGVIINTGATVDHDCNIAPFAHICPGVHLAGNVKIGKRTMIGIGSCVIQGVTIGDDITIGAGSVVTEDLLEPGLYVGAPAKLIKKRVSKC